jgi:FMN reductase
MSDVPLRILAIVGSQNRKSTTRAVINNLVERLRAGGCAVDVFDYRHESLDLFNPETSYEAPAYAQLQKRVEQADVFILGTPDYHGSMSSAIKSFLDHFWEEFAGKLFATAVSSHEKGLTVTDQLRTVARQCYAWSMPYGVSFAEGDDVREGKVVSENLEKRLEMFARDIRVYGEVIARQRRDDLGGTGPGFMARHRSTS